MFKNKEKKGGLFDVLISYKSVYIYNTLYTDLKFLYAFKTFKLYTN